MADGSQNLTFERMSEYQKALPIFSLLKASARGDLSETRRLIESGLDINMDLEGVTPLLAAFIFLFNPCDKNNVEVVSYLLSRGANPNHVVESGETVLSQALSKTLHHNIDGIVQLLISHGADVKCSNRAGWSAVLMAVMHGDVNIVKMIVDRSDPDTFVADREILHTAASRGFSEVLCFLIDQGIHVNTIDSHGWTALMRAALENKVDIAQVLLERGADVNIVDPNGLTALMLAAERGALDMAQLLINNNANIHLSTSKYWGADDDRGKVGEWMYYYAFYPFKRTNVGIGYPIGTTASALAQRNSYQEIVELLEIRSRN